jgi:hypothetical protein
MSLLSNIASKVVTVTSAPTSTTSKTTPTPITAAQKGSIGLSKAVVQDGQIVGFGSQAQAQSWTSDLAARMERESGGKGIISTLAKFLEIGQEVKSGRLTSSTDYLARGDELGLQRKTSDMFDLVPKAAKAISTAVLSKTPAGQKALEYQATTMQNYVSADPNTGTQTVNPDGTVSTQASQQTVDDSMLGELGLADLSGFAQSESPVAGLPWYAIFAVAGLAIYLVLKGK